MTAQTRSEFLLDKVAERLGVPKTEGQVFSPDPLVLLQKLVDLLADPAAAKKRVGEFAAAVDEARKAEAATKKAEASRARIYTEIDDAQKQHDEKLAGELAAHTIELQKRSLTVEQREHAADKREAQLDGLAAKIKADRERLDKKFSALKAAVE